MRPPSVLAIGILGIVFGLLGICCMGFALLGAGFIGSIAEGSTASTDPGVQLLMDPTYRRFTIFNAVLGIVFSIWLIIGSILFIQLKSLGWTLMVAYAVLSIGFTLLSVVLDFTLLAPVYERYQASRQPTAYAFSAIGLIYPIAVLIVATRPAIKERFQS